MLEHIPDALLEMEVAVPLAVTIIVLSRLFFGGTLFHVRWINAWNVIRRIKVPALNTYILGNVVPFDFEIENEVYEDEYVGVSPMDPKEIEMKMADSVDSEVPLLAGFKTDWGGRTEIATAVSYHGPRPWPGAPNWLRPRQTHRTYFRVLDDGGYKTLITAHEEANSYRPDKWSDHLFKKTFSAEEGVRRTMLRLEEAGVDWNPSASVIDTTPSADVGGA